MTSRVLFILVALFVCGLAGCGKRGPTISQEFLVGRWEGESDGDVKSREVHFGEDGKGYMRVVINSDSFKGSLRHDFTYQIDTKTNSAKLDNSGQAGSAELTPDLKLRFRLDKHDCILSRTK